VDFVVFGGAPEAAEVVLDHEKAIEQAEVLAANASHRITLSWSKPGKE
jgi:hypothetical protein